MDRTKHVRSHPISGMGVDRAMAADRARRADYLDNPGAEGLPGPDVQAAGNWRYGGEAGGRLDSLAAEFAPQVIFPLCMQQRQHTQ